MFLSPFRAAGEPGSAHPDRLPPILALPPEICERVTEKLSAADVVSLGWTCRPMAEQVTGYLDRSGRLSSFGGRPTPQARADRPADWAADLARRRQAALSIALAGVLAATVGSSAILDAQGGPGLAGWPCLGAGVVLFSLGVAEWPLGAGRAPRDDAPADGIPAALLCFSRQLSLARKAHDALLQETPGLDCERALELIRHLPVRPLLDEMIRPRELDWRLLCLAITASCREHAMPALPPQSRSFLGSALCGELACRQVGLSGMSLNDQSALFEAGIKERDLLTSFHQLASVWTANLPLASVCGDLRASCRHRTEQLEVNTSLMGEIGEQFLAMVLPPRDVVAVHLETMYGPMWRDSVPSVGRAVDLATAGDEASPPPADERPFAAR